MKNKKFAFSLLELIIAVAVITVLSGVVVFAYSERIEKNALIEMQNQIPTFFETICQKSFETGERYKLHCDLEGKQLEVADIDSGEVLEEFDLSEVLNYVFINSSNELSSEVDRNTTTTGNISKGFSIYIFDDSGEALYKIALSNSTEFVQYISINPKEPIKTMYLTDFTYGRELTEDEEELIDYDNWQ